MDLPMSVITKGSRFSLANLKSDEMTLEKFDTFEHFEDDFEVLVILQYDKCTEHNSLNYLGANNDTRTTRINITIKCLGMDAVQQANIHELVEW